MRRKEQKARGTEARSVCRKAWTEARGTGQTEPGQGWLPMILFFEGGKRGPTIRRQREGKHPLLMVPGKGGRGERAKPCGCFCAKKRKTEKKAAPAGRIAGRDPLSAHRLFPPYRISEKAEASETKPPDGRRRCAGKSLGLSSNTHILFICMFRASMVS